MLPLVSHGEYADGTERRTDGRTPDRYITLSAMETARLKSHTVCQPLYLILSIKRVSTGDI